MSQSAATRTRPLMCSPDMASKAHDGSKTQTRRIINPQPRHYWMGYQYGVGGEGTARLVGPDYPDAESDDVRCPHGQPGDRLWIREKLILVAGGLEYGDGTRVADCPELRAFLELPAVRPSIPSMYMPRWASRTLVVITEVRAQRVQEITTADILAEGLRPAPEADDETDTLVTFRAAFRDLWDSLNLHRGAWASNPWVFALTFTRVAA